MYILSIRILTHLSFSTAQQTEQKRKTNPWHICTPQPSQIKRNGANISFRIPSKHRISRLQSKIQTIIQNEIVESEIVFIVSLCREQKPKKGAITRATLLSRDSSQLKIEIIGKINKVGIWHARVCLISVFCRTLVSFSLCFFCCR